MNAIRLAMHTYMHTMPNCALSFGNVFFANTIGAEIHLVGDIVNEIFGLQVLTQLHKFACTRSVLNLSHQSNQYIVAPK